MVEVGDDNTYGWGMLRVDRLLSPRALWDENTVYLGGYDAQIALWGAQYTQNGQQNVLFTAQTGMDGCLTRTVPSDTAILKLFLLDEVFRPLAAAMRTVRP